MTTRTTIRLNEALKRRAKRRAAQRKTTFTRLVEEALREYLAKPQEPLATSPIVLPTFGDPNNPITEEQYQTMIEQMYAEEAAHILKGCRDSA